MGCKVTFSLLTESQQGNIGDDWKYTIEAKVFNQGLKGQGTISVAKHKLTTGSTQEPPGPPEAIVLDAGEPGSELMIRLNLTATEVDFLRSDTSENQISFHMNSPAAGEAPITHETDISVGVRESPGLMDETAVFTLKVRLVAHCD